MKTIHSPSSSTGNVLERPVGLFARSGAAIAPETLLSEAVELLRAGAYRVLPILSSQGQLCGQVSEADIALALSVLSPAEQAYQLNHPVSELMQPIRVTIPATMPASEALQLLRDSGQDALIVLDAEKRFVGMVGASDFVRQLLRPVRPPQLGGLATPLGVYLTNGDATGGAGAVALILTGFAFCVIHTAAFFVAKPLLPYTFYVPMALRPTATLLLQTMIQILLLFSIVRFSPMAGYHAAEHQVVHAIERGEPLTIETVRHMPRVHPRCGTNLVAGVLTASFLGIVLQPLVGTFGYLIGGATALAFWRDVGAWLQRYVTTRPAADRELENGIRAAHDVLAKLSQRELAEAKPVRRLWNMGFLPMITGFLLGCGLLALCSLWQPALREPLHAYLLSW